MPTWVWARDFSPATRLIKAGLVYADEVQLSSLPITAVVTRRLSAQAMEDLPAALNVLRDDLAQCLERSNARSSGLAAVRPATLRAMSALNDLQDALASGAVIVSRPAEGEPGARMQSNLEAGIRQIFDWLAGGMGLGNAPGEVPLLSEAEAEGWTNHAAGRHPIPEQLFDAPGSSRRMLEGMVTSRLFGALPAFPDAPIDVVLELRDALADARPHFGAALLSIARRLDDGVKSGEDLSELLVELERTDVLPALAELRRDAAALGFGDGLLRVAEGKTLAATAAIVVAAAATGGLAGLSHLVESLAVSAPIIATGAKETLYQRQRRRQLRAKPFWMLREVDRRLTR
jgi:hypothetical protein